MKRKVLVLGLASALMLSFAACTSNSGTSSSGDTSGSSAPVSDYPNRNITLIIPYEAGGSTDPLARMYGTLLEKELGATVIAQNMPGAAATLGTKFVVDAAPDGYTIGLGVGGAIAFQPLVGDTGYAGVEDMQGITKLADSVQAFTVKADARWQTMADFLAEAKERPGELTVAVAGEYSAVDLSVYSIENTLGVKLVHVPMAGGTGDAVTSVLSGRADATVTTVNGVAAQNEAGELRSLAVMGDKEVSIMPNIPTMASLGYNLPGSPGQVSVIFGPKGLPEDVLKILEDASLKVTNSQEFKDYLVTAGMVAEVLDVAGTTADMKENQDNYVQLADLLGLTKK